MIELAIPKLSHYDTDTARTLANALAGLKSLADVADWDTHAQAEIGRIREGIEHLRREAEKLGRQTKALQAQRESKGALSRMLSSTQQETQLKAQTSALYTEMGALTLLEGELTRAIEFTPDSPEDVGDLKKFVKLRRKEIKLEKRELATAMTGIRVQARQSTAFSFPGKYGKWSRRITRWSKEINLRPHETQKAAFDRQLLELDRFELWLDRLL
jgi:hypothetical protein